MKRTKIAVKFGAVCFALCFVFAASLALPAKIEAFSFSVSPSRYEIVMPPGKEYTGQIEVRNSSSVEQNFTASLEDWYYSESGEKITQKAGSTPYSLDGWITFQPDSVKVKPDEAKKISFKLKVPKEGAGEHFGVIFVQTAQAPKSPLTKSVGVTLSARIGLSILVYTTREPEPLAEVARLDIEPPAINKPLGVEMVFQNKGNTPIAATGTLVLFDKEGRTYWNQQISNLNTLPGKAITKNYTWESNLAAGDYSLLVDIKYNGADNKQVTVTQEKGFSISDDLEIEKVNAVFNQGTFKYFAFTKNTGSFQSTLSGQVLIEDKTGSVVKKIDLPAATLIPGGTRYYTDSARVSLKPGDYKVTFKINNNKIEKTKSVELKVK